MALSEEIVSFFVLDSLGRTGVQMSVDDEEAGVEAKNGSHESQASRWDSSAAWNWAEEQRFHWSRKM